MAFTNPSVQDFKDQFIRDFPYGTDPKTSFLDQDIINAFKRVNANFNTAIWTDQNEYTQGYLLLAAHYLQSAYVASSQGVSGQYNFMQQSKGVSGVSESFAIPQHILDHPTLLMYCKTHYGLAYAETVYPKLTGQMFSAYGHTKP